MTERGKTQGERGPRAAEWGPPGSPEYMAAQQAAVERDLAEHGVAYFLGDAAGRAQHLPGDETVRELASVADVEQLATLDIRTTPVPGHRHLFAMVILLARGVLQQRRQIKRLEDDLEAVKNSLDGWR